MSLEVILNSLRDPGDPHVSVQDLALCEVCVYMYGVRVELDY